MTDMEYTQEIVLIVGEAYDSLCDATMMLADLVTDNPMLGEVEKINELQKLLTKAIRKIESEMP